MINDDVRLKYYNGYFDGPLSGVAEWRGERYYFTMTEEADWGEDVEEPPWHRRYALYELTEEEWAEEDARHACFERHVGTHTSYRRDGTRDYGGVKPQHGWKKYYQRYSQPRSWEMSADVERPVVHTFTR